MKDTLGQPLLSFVRRLSSLGDTMGALSCVLVVTSSKWLLVKSPLQCSPFVPYRANYMITNWVHLRLLNCLISAEESASS